MYGGDEVSAVVLDLGTHSVKAGYAGQDTPQHVFPSDVGTCPKSGDVDMTDGSSASTRDFYVDSMGVRRDGVEVQSPFGENGMLEDWEAVESIWEHALKKCLAIQTDEHPILLSEPVHNSDAVRAKMTELMFEKYAPPALFLAKNPVLSSFAVGKASSLVIDMGGKHTTVSAVHDGYALQKPVVKEESSADFERLAGTCKPSADAASSNVVCLPPMSITKLDALSDVVAKYLENQKIDVRPRYAFTKKQKGDGEFEVKAVNHPKTTASYAAFKRLEIMEDIKATVCRLDDHVFNSDEHKNVAGVTYELPDGNTIEVGVERFQIPELLFQPELLKELDVKVPALSGDTKLKSIPDLVLECINKSDVDVRKDLWGNLVLGGGCSMFANMRERLEGALFDHAPQNVKTKVIASMNSVERRYATWIGGSILASLGSFQQLWMSKQEYEEHGANLVQRKCP